MLEGKAPLRLRQLHVGDPEVEHQRVERSLVPKDIPYRPEAAVHRAKPRGKTPEPLLRMGYRAEVAVQTQDPYPRKGLEDRFRISPQPQSPVKDPGAVLSLRQRGQEAHHLLQQDRLVRHTSAPPPVSSGSMASPALQYSVHLERSQTSA